MGDEALYDERVRLRARILELEAEQQDFHDEILGGMRKIAELEAARDRLGLSHNQYVADAGRIVTRLEKENALLRKALEDAPHTAACRSNRTCSIPEHGCFPCDCWKAALARIPEPKP